MLNEKRKKPYSQTLKYKFKMKFVDWQYNPYGSRKHLFAFSWLTGRSFLYSLRVALRKK